MNTITVTYAVYKYSELSESSKEKVKNWYLDGPMRAEIFTDSVLENVRAFFPKSELDIQYSLSSCQGDGVNIYGDLNLLDMLERTKHKFTDKEYKRLRYYFTNFGDVVTLGENRKYCYCIADRYAYTDSTHREMEQCCIRDIDVKLLDKFDACAAKTLKELCSRYERDGYNYFYNVDDEELIDCCEENSWYFLENGTLLAG